MTLHNQPAYNHQALVEALKRHDLPHDTPSQVADGFRLGWTAAIDAVQGLYEQPVKEGE